MTKGTDFQFQHPRVKSEALGAFVAVFVEHSGRNEPEARLRVGPDNTGNDVQHDAAHLAGCKLVGAQPVAVHVLHFGIKIHCVQMLRVSVHLHQLLAPGVVGVDEKLVDILVLPAFPALCQVAVALHKAVG